MLPPGAPPLGIKFTGSGTKRSGSGARGFGCFVGAARVLRRWLGYGGLDLGFTTTIVTATTCAPARRPSPRVGRHRPERLAQPRE